MYNVPPFSQAPIDGPHIPEGFEGCAICKRPVRVETARHWAVVVDGGSGWGDDGSDTADSGFMGAFPVGNDCHRKYRQR
jgi:hypothetical protein